MHLNDNIIVPTTYIYNNINCFIRTPVLLGEGGVWLSHTFTFFSRKRSRWNQRQYIHADITIRCWLNTKPHGNYTTSTVSHVFIKTAQVPQKLNQLLLSATHRYYCRSNSHNSSRLQYKSFMTTGSSCLWQWKTLPCSGDTNKEPISWDNPENRDEIIKQRCTKLILLLKHCVTAKMFRFV